MGDRNGDKKTEKRKKKKQMWKLQRNCFIAYSLQVTFRLNKKRLNEQFEDEMVDEQCGFRKERSCTEIIQGYS